MYEGDVPEEAAAAFCQEHNLPAVVAAPLAKRVREALGLPSPAPEASSVQTSEGSALSEPLELGPESEASFPPAINTDGQGDLQKSISDIQGSCTPSTFP